MEHPLYDAKCGGDVWILVDRNHGNEEKMKLYRGE
jgi:hypothetical protein